MSEKKRAWQRKQRAAFRERYGYSTASHYATGGLRQQVLERDGAQCVRCGLTDAQHKEHWGRPITVDHKDKDKSHNTLDNLQTLCLRCHGTKDILPRLIQPHLSLHKEEVLSLRQGGTSYQAIADQFHFSIATIWKWCRRWESQRQ